MKKPLKFLALVLSSLTLASGAGFVEAAGPETSTETPTKTSAKTSTAFSDEEVKNFDSILEYLQQIEEVLKKEPEYILDFRMYGKKSYLIEYYKTSKLYYELRGLNPEYEFRRFSSYCEREHKEIPEILANDPGVFYIMKTLYEINNNAYPGDWGDIPCRVSNREDYVSILLYAICDKYKLFFPEVYYCYVNICISEGNMTIKLCNAVDDVFKRTVCIKTRT